MEFHFCPKVFVRSSYHVECIVRLCRWRSPCRVVHDKVRCRIWFCLPGFHLPLGYGQAFHSKSDGLHFSRHRSFFRLLLNLGYYVHFQCRYRIDRLAFVFVLWLLFGKSSIVRIRGLLPSWNFLVFFRQ